MAAFRSQEIVVFKFVITIVQLEVVVVVLVARYKTPDQCSARTPRMDAAPQFVRAPQQSLIFGSGT